MNFHALAGMKDYLGSSAEFLSEIIEIGRNQFRSAGFREIKTPLMEDARLFDRSLGSESDIISKEMYTIEQAEDRVIALRPENTAGVVRSVLQHKLLSRHNQLKLFYAGPMFRHERPQSGRLRQFHQLGVEVFGRSDPLIDAEVICLADELLKNLDVRDVKLRLNSLGTPKTRDIYIKKLKSKLQEYLDDLCEDCNRRYESAPLRMLDCKNDDCQEIYLDYAPEILESLDTDSTEHFNTLKKYLQAFGVEYVVDPYLVRGLEYYTRTTFEFVTDSLGSQDAVIAGGRYDELTEELGGDSCPAIGFGAGLERIMLLRDGFQGNVETKVDCFVVTFGEESLNYVLPIVKELRRRKAGKNSRPLRVELGEPNTSVKSKMRRANRYGARVVLLLGSEELENNEITLKEMDTGEQKTIDLENRTDLIENIMDSISNVDPDKLGDM